MNIKEDFFLLEESKNIVCKVSHDDNSLYLEYLKVQNLEKIQLKSNEILIGQYILNSESIAAHYKKLIKSGVEFPINLKLPIQTSTSKRKKRNNIVKYSSEYLQATPLYVNNDEIQLKNFQTKGVEWLINNQIGILADDMGLGKTVQAIFGLKRLYKKEI